MCRGLLRGLSSMAESLSQGKRDAQAGARSWLCTSRCATRLTAHRPQRAHSRPRWRAMASATSVRQAAPPATSVSTPAATLTAGCRAAPRPLGAPGTCSAGVLSLAVARTWHCCQPRRPPAAGAARRALFPLLWQPLQKHLPAALAAHHRSHASGTPLSPQLPFWRPQPPHTSGGAAAAPAAGTRAASSVTASSQDEGSDGGECGGGSSSSSSEFEGLAAGEGAARGWEDGEDKEGEEEDDFFYHVGWSALEDEGGDNDSGGEDGGWEEGEWPARRAAKGGGAGEFVLDDDTIAYWKGLCAQVTRWVTGRGGRAGGRSGGGPARRQGRQRGAGMARALPASRAARSPARPPWRPPLSPNSCRRPPPLKRAQSIPGRRHRSRPPTSTGTCPWACPAPPPPSPSTASMTTWARAAPTPGRWF
jgi:hypothetical protein